MPSGRPTRFTKVNGKTIRINVIQKIAEIFWSIPPGWKARQGCETLNCVNPDHFEIVRE